MSTRHHAPAGLPGSFDPGQRGGRSRGPALFHTAPGAVSAARREGNRRHGTCCFHPVLASPWGQTESVHHKSGPGGSGGPLTCPVRNRREACLTWHPSSLHQWGLRLSCAPNTAPWCGGLSQTVRDTTTLHLAPPCGLPSSAGVGGTLCTDDCVPGSFAPRPGHHVGCDRRPWSPAQPPLLQSALVEGCDAAWERVSPSQVPIKHH